VSEPDELLPLYRDNDHTRVRFVDGPSDGETVTWTTGEPPSGIRLPVDPGLPTLADLADPFQPLAIALYRPRLDGIGQPSRDDDGTLVYEYVGQ
jgi:hypothetical protein